MALRATADPPDYMIARRLHSNRFTLVASPAYLERCGRPTCVSEVAEHAALATAGRLAPLFACGATVSC